MSVVPCTKFFSTYTRKFHEAVYSRRLDFSDLLVLVGLTFNDAAADKIRKYRADYNNRPPSAVSFLPAIASTSDRLHSEFVRILFLQAHRETDRFFSSSGVHLAQTPRWPVHLSPRGFYFAATE